MKVDVSRSIMKAIDAIRPIDQWAKKCHQASIALLETGHLPTGRVARGWHKRVPGQHSWVTLGSPYDAGVTIVDPTLWSYCPDMHTDVWVVHHGGGGQYTPHGSGSIWKYGKPTWQGGKTICLHDKTGLSGDALEFLSMLEQEHPLDYEGWSQLAHAPVGDWPAKEIIAAMYDTEGLQALIPIDIVGMVTDRNPGGLYLPKDVISGHGREAVRPRR